VRGLPPRSFEITTLRSAGAGARRGRLALVTLTLALIAGAIAVG
jgi:hypothetical protein